MKRLLSVLIILVMLPLQAEAQSSWWKFWESADEAAGVSDTLFTPEQKRILRDYLRSQGVAGEDDDDDDRNGKKFKDKKGKKHKSLPPGLKKKLERGGELPPGWQKKVARGEVMDAELYELSEDLPPGILRQLGDAPEGTSVRRVEDRVVRIMDATGAILDVLTGQ